MDLFEAIRSRRSIGKVKPDPVERHLIERIIEAGTWAPNHKNTEPWRFFVLTGEGRKPLGRVLAEIEREKFHEPLTEEEEQKVEKQAEKPFRAPVIIAVAVQYSGKVPPIEEICAVSAAVQNILLAAHGLGLGAIWRTGDPTYHPKMKELFGLREQDEMVGFIYLGYPDIKPNDGKRTYFLEKTSWFDQNGEYK